MKELQEILAAWQQPHDAGQPMALATLVEAEGSAYRRPGARMLICGDGRRIGALSGGCLEADVAERARQVMATGEPQLAQYNAQSGYDLVVEMGCRGAVGIFIEPASASVLPLRFLADCVQNRKTGALATVFRVDKDSALKVGNRVTFVAGQWETDCSDAALATAIAADLARIAEGGQAQAKHYCLSEGGADALLEPILPPIALLICGAGQDAIPLVQFASLLGWQTTVLDARPDLLTRERFPAAQHLEVIRAETCEAILRVDARMVVVVMTHNYCQDLTLLQHLLPSSAPYIGLLGPRRRAERLLDDLAREGIAFSSDCLARLHSPAGLDIGSESPEQIALSIVAEIQAALAGRAGGFLRQRVGSIHAGSARLLETARPGLSDEGASCRP